MIISKKAIANGMTNISFIFYSNALASLILLPSSLLLHRSNHPPLNFTVICGFVLCGILGFLAQVFGYTGISYSSATLCTVMLNLTPGFTFVLAIFFRMEKVDCGSPSTLAKSVGTVVSIVGAIIVTLYKGPAIITAQLHSIIPHQLLAQPSDWIIGGLFLAIDCVFSSLFTIAQALVLRKYPAELTVTFAYCFLVTILSALVSLITERDLKPFSLQPKIRLFSILYSGVFGSVVQVTIGAWCLRRKGPVFVAMFHPVGIVISTVLGVIFLGDGLYLGGLVGSFVIVVGFYSVMWGKATEEKSVEFNNSRKSKFDSDKVPLLQEDVEETPNLLSV